MPVDLKAVKRELNQFGRKLNKYPTYRVSKHSFRAAPGISSVMHKGVVHGETNNYMVHVQFFKVKFSKEKKKDYEPVNVDGTLWYYKVPTIRSNPAKLKCSGPDFRFRFEKELSDEKGLIGNWRRYVRKTPPPPVGRPYANPDHYLGFCKHTYSLLKYLKNAGFLKE
ncbi:MAG: hypothetical protein ACW991_02890 [Candidatus Hodarchaeales archaeon]|jgi:hypothetical protein